MPEDMFSHDASHVDLFKLKRGVEKNYGVRLFRVETRKGYIFRRGNCHKYFASLLKRVHCKRKEFASNWAYVALHTTLSSFEESELNRDPDFCLFVHLLFSKVTLIDLFVFAFLCTSPFLKSCVLYTFSFILFSCVRQLL